MPPALPAANLFGPEHSRGKSSPMLLANLMILQERLPYSPFMLMLMKG